MFIKKDINGFLLLLMFVSFIFGFNIKFVCADNKYYIDDYEQKIKINIDGSADFEEKMVYVFNGKFNGIYFNLDYKNCGDFKDYSVSILKNNKEFVLEQNDSGEENTYKLNFDDDMVYFKVFSPSRSKRKTFVFKYKLSQPIVKLRDGAEFNRKLIPDNFETGVKKFKVLINFEHENINKNDLKIFVNGPSNSKDKIYDDGTVCLKVNNLPAKNFVEADLIFPESYVKNLKAEKSDITRDEIIKYKMEERESEKKKKQGEIAITTILVVFIAFAIAYKALVCSLLDELSGGSTHHSSRRLFRKSSKRSSGGRGGGGAF